MSELDFDRSDPPIMPGRRDARTLSYLDELASNSHEADRRSHLLNEKIIPKLGHLTADELAEVHTIVDSMARRNLSARYDG